MTGAKNFRETVGDLTAVLTPQPLGLAWHKGSAFVETSSRNRMQADPTVLDIPMSTGRWEGRLDVKSGCGKGAMVKFVATLTFSDRLISGWGLSGTFPATRTTPCPISISGAIDHKLVKLELWFEDNATREIPFELAGQLDANHTLIEGNFKVACFDVKLGNCPGHTGEFQLRRIF